MMVIALCGLLAVGIWILGWQSGYSNEVRTELCQNLIPPHTLTK